MYLNNSLASLNFTRLLITTVLMLCGISTLQANVISPIVGYVQTPAGDYQGLSIGGWACHKGRSESVAIDVYAGKDFANASLLFTEQADRESEQAVDTICAAQGDFRFKFNIEQATIYQHSGDNLYIIARSNTQTGALRSSKTLSIPKHPQTRVAGFLDAILPANGAYFAAGWTCQTHYKQALSIDLFVKVDGSEVKLVENAVSEVIAEPGVTNSCASNYNKHRFRVKLPAFVIEQYAGKRLYARAHSPIHNQAVDLAQYRRLLIPSHTPTHEERSPNVIFIVTDDQGYADLSVQQALQDVYTPNIDALAANGVRFTQAYITAPQCSPSRAGIISGQYQQRFGLDENRHIPMSSQVTTIAERFKQAGYRTGMIGKWHLEVMNTSGEWAQKYFPDMSPFNAKNLPQAVTDPYFPHRRGFDDMFAGYSVLYYRNINERGQNIAPQKYINHQFRVDLVNDTALTFVDNNWRRPFFLYLSPYAPHVPLEASKKYLDRFSEDMPKRRRYALAMMAAIDDGVGQLVSKLDNYNILDNTMIVFLSDNGAPLGDDMTDAPINNTREEWNGSRNDPFTGEKGMLTEGALRIPFVLHWPKRIQQGLEIDTPISSLDASYTALKYAGVTDLDSLDGQDLIPLIDGEPFDFEQRALFWRFYFQRAIRKGDWKYMQAGIQREYLFDMSQSDPESVNLINSYPDIAAQLRQEYWQWASQMPRPEPLVEIPKPFAVRIDRFLPLPTP